MRSTQIRLVVCMGWWARKDLNLGPTDYESDALTAELRAPAEQHLSLKEALAVASGNEDRIGP